MLTEDYIMRMINQAIAALVAIAGFKKAGQYEQSRQAIDQALEQLIGLRADLVRRLDDQAILQALTRQDNLDVDRLALVAELLKEEGEILAAQGDRAAAQASWLRGLNFFLEAGLAEGSAPAPVLSQKINLLVDQLGLACLSDDTVWALFCYTELAGQYGPAAATLEHLAARPGVYDDLRPELAAFYQRLLALTPAELAQSGLERSVIERKYQQSQQ